MRSLLLFSLLVMMTDGSIAQKFEQTAATDRAYALLLDLQFKAAEQELDRIRTADTDNRMVTYLADLSDFLYIVTSEDEAAFNERKQLRSERIRYIENVSTENPYRLMAKGEIHLHWAFSMMRFGEYFNAAREINRAFKTLEENMQRHPDFIPTYKGMGLLHTLIGTVPDKYRWATKLMGVDGTIEQGTVEMERVLNHDDPKLKNVKKETLFLLTFLQMNILNDPDALNRSAAHLRDQSGPLMDFAKASVARKKGDSETAISILDSAVRKYPTSFPYLYYLLGELKLSRADADADQAFLKYLSVFKGKSYRKSAKQYIAWHHLISKNDSTTYRKWMRSVQNDGNTMLDEDDRAQQASISENVPNKTLLKARLQFDGGFMNDALRTLVSAEDDAIHTKEEELEFTYRLGRIYHAKGDTDSAIRYYKMTIDSGRESSRYFAANASLQLGLIHEQLGNRNQALKAFNRCSSFPNKEYRNSIQQKAKAGIDRLTH